MISIDLIVILDCTKIIMNCINWFWDYNEFDVCLLFLFLIRKIFFGRKVLFPCGVRLNGGLYPGLCTQNCTTHRTARG